MADATPDESLQFKEIEHKFIVDERFDAKAFATKVRALGPRKSTKVKVTDTYFITKASPGFIFRHRYDEELQQLTVKNLADDPEVRLEVNLDLCHEHGNQREAVAAFLSAQGVVWSGFLNKKLEAFHFDDCEIVFYEAKTAGNSVRCVEFESLYKKDLRGAKEVLSQYERRVGFDDKSRTHHTLFDLLLLPNIPKNIQDAMIRQGR